MSEQKVKAWKTAQNDRKQAEAWENLPNGQKYQNDTFRISVAHCNPPKLVRCGQQYSGGQNYWNTEEGFNKAILEWVVKNWSKVYPEVLGILKEKEKAALKDCQDYVNEMQALISACEE